MLHCTPSVRYPAPEQQITEMDRAISGEARMTRQLAPLDLLKFKYRLDFPAYQHDFRTEMRLCQIFRLRVLMTKAD